MDLKINLATEKWRLIWKVMAFNSLIVAITVLFLWLIGYVSLGDFKRIHEGYFFPLKKSYSYLFSHCLESPIWEEISFRTPIWILSSTGLVFILKKFRLGLILAWLAILIPDYFWAINHSPAALPVFLAGISFGWLVFKTRSLWPAIVAHCGANLSIYFCIKLTALFIKI